jgi:hypothetical protein
MDMEHTITVTAAKDSRQASGSFVFFPKLSFPSYPRDTIVRQCGGICHPVLSITVNPLSLSLVLINMVTTDIIMTISSPQYPTFPTSYNLTIASVTTTLPTGSTFTNEYNFFSLPLSLTAYWTPP